MREQTVGVRRGKMNRLGNPRLDSHDDEENGDNKENYCFPFPQFFHSTPSRGTDDKDDEGPGGTVIRDRSNVAESCLPLRYAMFVYCSYCNVCLSLTLFFIIRYDYSYAVFLFHIQS